MFKKILVDCHARIDLPHPLWARDTEMLVTELEYEAKDLTAFLHDHRSRDAYGIAIVREYEVRCSFCGYLEERDETGCPVCCERAVEEWKGVKKREWVEQRACDLAQKIYSKLYCDLPPVLQQLVSADAEQDYISYYSGRLDAAYESELDRRLEESQRKCCDCPVGSNYCGR